jgi:protein-disulfide isomerase
MRARRRSTWTWIGGAIVAALVVVGVLVGMSVAGGSSGNASVTRAEGQASSMLAGVPQHGMTLGRASAPATLTEYVDLQCPVCREAAIDLVPHVVDRWVRGGTVRLVLRPLAFIGPDSVRGALATQAAGSQNRAWTFAETLYRVQGAENSGWLDEGVVTDAARAVGLDAGAFDAARNGSETGAAVQANTTAFEAIGSGVTPTFVVQGPGGRQGIAGLPSAAALDAAVAHALGRS